MGLKLIRLHCHYDIVVALLMTDTAINDQLMKSIANPSRLRDESLIDPFETRTDPSNDLLFDLSVQPSVMPVMTPVNAANPFEPKVVQPVVIKPLPNYPNLHKNKRRNRHHRHHHHKEPSLSEVDESDASDAAESAVPSQEGTDVGDDNSDEFEGEEAGGNGSDDGSGLDADTESSYEHQKRSRRHRHGHKHSSSRRKYRHSSRRNRTTMPVPSAPIVDDFDTFKQTYYHQDENLEKMEILNKMAQIEREGGRPNKKYTAINTIDELRYELYRLTREQTREKSVQWMQQSLVTGVRMLEMANKKFDPIGLKLQGFSRTVLLEMDNYRPSLLAIYSKYSNTRASTSNPVIQLLLTLLGSLLFHHISVVSQKEAEANSRMTSAGKVLQSLAGKSVPVNPFTKRATTGTARPTVAMHGPPPDSDDD